MTVQKDVTKNIYVGNGSTRTYPFTFECPAEHPEYIKVYLIQEDGTAQVTVDYLLDMDARQITYPSSGAALPDGKKLVIMRELPLQQQMNLVNNGPYFAEDIEQAFDENVMAMQQIAEKLNRTITMSVDVDGSAFINEVPFEAGKSFRIADDGKSIVLTEDPARVLPLAQSKLEAATAQANIAAAKAAAAAESESKAESYSTAADASKTAAAASSSDAANSAAVAAGYKADTLLMKNAVAENVKAAKESEANAKQASVSASASETEAKAAKVAANEAAANASNSASEAKRYESEANSYAENAKEYAATATTKASETTAKVIEATDEANRAKAEADRAKSISENIGNPVSDVTENNGTVTVTKSNGTQSTFMAFPQDANGTLPIAKGGTGANNAKQARANLEVEPIGTIYAFAGNNIPNGYLPCNGSAISRTTYADLFAVIGTTYGSGDSSTTFNLPNLSTNLISNVSTGNLQVKGNGIALGLTDGTNNYGLSDTRSGTLNWSPLVSNDKAYGKPVGGTTEESGKNRVSFMGITTDGSKSGMIVPMSATKTTVKYIIKY